MAEADVILVGEPLTVASGGVAVHDCGSSRC